MGVTSILTGNDFPEFKNYIKANAPKKNMFISSTGYPAFSKEIPIQVPGAAETAYETALVGELADYIFYLDIIRFLKKDKFRYFNDLFRPLVQSYKFIIRKDPENGKKYQKRFHAMQIACVEYIMGKSVNQEELVEHVNLMNKVDHYHHIRHQDLDEYWSKFLEPCNKRITEDVIALAALFQTNFLGGGYVKKNSVVSFQPWFGMHNTPEGKADICIDGVLYDFKSTKKNGFCWTDVGQVYSYYLLHSLDMKYYRDTVLAQPIPITDVTAIALYYSRYGDVEFCSLKNTNSRINDDKLRVLTQLINDNVQKRRDTLIEILTKETPR